MLSFVVQNFSFYSIQSFFTLRYKYLVLYKMIFFISIFTKYLMYLMRNKSLISHFKFYNYKFINMHYKLFKLYTYRKHGVWTNNLIKSFMYNSLAILHYSLFEMDKFNKRLEIPLTVLSPNYFKPFEILSFNVSGSVFKKNIMLLMNWLTNFNSSFLNYYNVYSLFFLYPQYFIFLPFNNYYYFKIRRY